MGCLVWGYMLYSKGFIICYTPDYALWYYCCDALDVLGLLVTWWWGCDPLCLNHLLVMLHPRVWLNHLLVIGYLWYYQLGCLLLCLAMCYVINWVVTIVLDTGDISGYMLSTSLSLRLSQCFPRFALSRPYIVIDTHSLTWGIPIWGDQLSSWLYLSAGAPDVLSRGLLEFIMP